MKVWCYFGADGRICADSGSVLIYPERGPRSAINP